MVPTGGRGKEKDRTLTANRSLGYVDRVNEQDTIEYPPATLLEHVLPKTSFRDVDPEILVDAVAGEMSAGARPGLVELAEGMGVPPQDCLGTVFSARATLMAAARGRAFYYHELRGRIPMPPQMHPEVEVWEEGTVPVWKDGVLMEPKYFSFRQDAPFAAFNPVHRRKWRPHELLHGAVGFFWKPDATRFETYVGARLNELLPVVHWYGLDEIFRPRCDRHRGQLLYREWCGDCEDAVRPYWEVEPVDREAAIRFVRNAQEHFAREMETCRREIETREVHETPLGRLNASTDAVGYLLGHWPRMSSWSFRTWAEFFLRDGVDYFSDLAEYADRVEACCTKLVGGPVVTTYERFETLRQRRVLQDLGYRALIALEWLDPNSDVDLAVDKTVMGALERCGEAVDGLADGDEARWEAEDALDNLIEVLEDVRDAFDDEIADPLLAVGLPFWEPGRDDEFELTSLAHGISQGAPLTADRLDAGHITTFVESEFFGRTGRLVSRFATYLRDRADRKGPKYRTIADLASLEAWAAVEPRRDEQAERFGHRIETLDNVEPSRLRLNRTFRRAEFGAQAVGELVDVRFASDPVELAAAYWHGELHLVVVDDAVRDILDAIEGDAMPEPADRLIELCDAGLVVWLP